MAFKNTISSKFKNMTAKKIAIISIICFIILVPSFIAIFSAIYSEFWLSPGTAKITMQDHLGSPISISSEEERNALEKIFKGIATDKLPTNKTTADLTDKEYIYVSVTDSSGSTSAKYYFSLTPEDALVLYKSGELYSIPGSYNSAFLKTKYAQRFYSSSKPIRLVSSELDTITPKTCSWFYKNVAGSFIESTSMELLTDRKTYTLSAPLKFSFDRIPTHCSVKVYDGDSIIYQGNIHNLSSLSVNIGTTLRITIDADWAQDKINESYGKVSYDFNVRIIDKFDFLINTDKISAGDFFLLYCNNVTDISKLTFESNIDGFQPNFVRSGNSTISAIHLPKNTSVDNFIFTVSCGSVSKSFAVKINKDTVPREFSYSSLVFSSPNEPTVISNAAKSLIMQTNTEKNDIVYFQGNFLDPTVIGFDLAYSHGSTVKWGKGQKNKFTAFGNEYTVSDKSNITYVPSLHSGTVVKTGTNASIGKYVVVDHGCGLKTWYSHLGSIDVEIGQVVVKGQSIGKLGNASFKDIRGFTLYCSINNDPISPSSLINIKAK